MCPSMEQTYINGEKTMKIFLECSFNSYIDEVKRLIVNKTKYPMKAFSIKIVLIVKL